MLDDSVYFSWFRGKVFAVSILNLNLDHRYLCGLRRSELKILENSRKSFKNISYLKQFFDYLYFAC